MKRGEGRVMLSYARPDKDQVQLIYDRLQQGGFCPWMDIHNIPPGADYRLEIQKAIRSSDVFMPVISQHSVDRPGVLQGELKEALDIWNERLDRSGFLIPVRLEPIPLPASLSHLQKVDLFAPDGWDRLLEGVRRSRNSYRQRLWRRVAWVAAIAVVCVAATWIGFRMGQYGRESAAFAASRPGSNLPVDANQVRMGFTLWRATKSNETGGGCSALGFQRVGFDSRFRAGDALRIGFESTKAGFLYVFNREVISGRPAEWYLIYPTLKMRGGANAAAPGVLLEMPPNDQVCATFALESSQSGAAEEQLLFVLSPTRIEELPARDSDYLVASSLVESLISRSSKPVQQSSSEGSIGAARSAEEDEAAFGQARRLRYNEARPQTILIFDDGAAPPFSADITLKDH